MQRICAQEANSKPYEYRTGTAAGGGPASRGQGAGAERDGVWRYRRTVP